MRAMKILEKINSFFEGKHGRNSSTVPLESDEEAMLVMENRSLINRELYMEAARALSRRWTRYAAIAFGILLILAGIALSESFLIIGGGIITVLSTFSWQIIVRRDFEKLKTRHNAENWLKTVRFYSNRIETEAASGSISTFAYGSIKKLLETKNMFIIVFDQRQPANMLRKDSFTIGTCDLAMAFISEMRGIQA